jgi:F-type H+-transporting ATPase subunit epsilon
MKLAVATPLAIVVEVNEVMQLRAEDETGAFGILPGHADFLTALSLSVVTWRDPTGREHHVAVRGGTLEVRGGKTIRIATREAVADDNLSRLETEVLATFRRRTQDEAKARIDAQRLYLAAIRQICRFLKPEHASELPGAAVLLPEDGLEP